MEFLSIFLFAIVSSCDNFIVGLSYGLKNIKVSFLINLIMALITGLSTFIIMLVGKNICNSLPLFYSNLLGSMLLIFLGIYLLINSFKSFKKDLNYYQKVMQNPEIIDSNNSKNIELKEAIVLGLILCLNNIGLGIGASISGLNIFITSILSFLFSLILLPLGLMSGTKISNDKTNLYLEVISSLLIIILGIYELIM